MVRTKADCGSAAGRKVVAARAPRKSLGASSSAGSGSSGAGASPAGSKYAGGNPACPRPTPDWQKGIGTFFTRAPDRENQEPQEPEVSEEEPRCSGSESGGSQPGRSSSNSSSSPSVSKTKARRRRIEDDSDEEGDS